MTKIDFKCDRCGTPVSGIHTATGTAGFYVVDGTSGSWGKYRMDAEPPEHFVCDECIQSMPEYQADYPHDE